MNKWNFWFVFVAAALVGLQGSCNREQSQEEAYDEIEELWSEIVALSESKTCTDADEWKFVGYGYKSCNGPLGVQGYIAYSSKIDTTYFLELIQEHRGKQIEYCEKWGCVSTCDLNPDPIGVECSEEGRPSLVY